MDPVRPDRPPRVGSNTIIETIGEGPRGAVYLGQEAEESSPRVIKLLAPEAGQDADVVQRLRSLNRVSSSYVARVLDAGVWEGRPYVVREHVAGRSLAELVAAEGPLPDDALERVAVGVLTALIAMHLKGLAHGGLTPHNVILAPDGPKVTDMAAGPPAGELGYRSPEQLNGEVYGPYSDVFSWAAVVVFAAAGRPPFGHDPQTVMNAAPDLGHLPEPIRGVVASALAKPVAQRPTAQAALLRLLGEADKPVPALPTDATRHANPPIPSAYPPAHMSGPSAGRVSPGEGAAWPHPGHGEAPPRGAPVRPGSGSPASAGTAVPPGPPVPHPTASSGQTPTPPSWGPRVAGPQASARSQPARPGAERPSRSFPVLLVAAVAVVVLLSGVGLWGASKYAEQQPLRPAAATMPGTSSTPAPVGTGEPPISSSQPEATVPWAGTPDPQDTAPLPFEVPTEPTAGPVPELTTVPTPPPVPTQPVPQPTVTVTKQATVTPSPTTSAASKQQDSPKPTKTQQKPTEEPEPAHSTTSARPPSKTPPPEVPAGGRPMNISTNYAWARGSVSWNGTVATANGQLQDTMQYESHSWVRIAYKAYVSGAWKVRYAQPDPYVNVSNGQSANISFSMNGPVKDVQWDLCSRRLEKTFCTGWS
ncbi:serine/threonine protein kinase [Nonomuraea sp. CA-141351]|uniref:serine/threonine protein kinase n=1 Tax=Nonomuraea sp. CA-141351 TaxID=3239996 RepID=UPI003D8E4EA3